MKTSGKILWGLFIISIAAALYAAISTYRLMTNSHVKKNITTYYTKYDLSSCDTVIVYGNISVTLEKNDSVGIKYVALPAGSKDSVLITKKGKSLFVTSTDRMEKGPVPMITINLAKLRTLHSTNHAKLYVKGFSGKDLTAIANDKSYIKLNEVTADSLLIISYDKAKIRTENGKSLIVMARLYDKAKAELSFPIECDSSVNAQRKLYLNLTGKSYLNLWGSYGSLIIHRSPGSVMEVFNITDKVRDCNPVVNSKPYGLRKK